jgi:hypothetical protein
LHDARLVDHDDNSPHCGCASGPRGKRKVLAKTCKVQRRARNRGGWLGFLGLLGFGEKNLSDENTGLLGFDVDFRGIPK